MTVAEVLTYCQERRVILRPEGGQLKVNAPKRYLTPDLLALLKQHKPELLALLRGAALPSASTPEPVAEPEPRPSTPTAICRCGSQEFEDFSIHDGESTRRDCAQCGRFWAFVAWHRSTN